MSQPSQDSSTPMSSGLANAPSRIVIGAEVSREKLLQDLNLSARLRERIQVHSTTEGSNRKRFFITCPDYWAWDEVLRAACLLGDQYDVNLGPRLSNSPGLVEDQAPAELATPTSGVTPGPSTFATVSNTPAFSSPWALQAGNSLHSPTWEVQGSPFFTQALNNIQETPPVFSEATPSILTSSSVFQSSAGGFKHEETSDDDMDFFAVAEGDEEYVQEWDGRNAGMEEDEEEEDGESSPSGESSFECQGGGIPAHHYRGLDHYPDLESDGPTASITETNEEEEEEEEESMTSDNIGGPDSDQEMTEEDETQAIVEEPITSGYEADHSESDAARSPQQRRRGTPHPRAALSPSGLRAISETSSATSSVGTAEIDDPPAKQSGTTQGTSSILGPLLDSMEDEVMGDAAEPAMDGLVNGLLGLALPSPDEVQAGSSLQAGQITAPGQPPQDSPDTSAESDILRDMLAQSLERTSSVDYVKAMAPAGYEGNGFVEVTRE